MCILDAPVIGAGTASCHGQIEGGCTLIGQVHHSITLHLHHSLCVALHIRRRCMNA
jgi:hypothetical protein